jgi:putative acetyltransferase
MVERLEDVRTERADITSRRSQALVDALDVELSARYPEERVNEYRVEPAEVSVDRGCFLVAIRGDVAIGCCALRRLSDNSGEIKRMYVVPEERGRGVAKVLLMAIEDAARTLGIMRLVLETGVRQPEAIRLYERHGFARIPRFGDYMENPLSVWMGKDLPSAPGRFKEPGDSP